jgi:serine/threonine protein kinase
MPSPDELSAAAGLPVLTPGLVLSGRFRLEALAGQGGMSVVWRATDTVLEHETALKFLPTILASDRAALADLRREARRARDLAHPHVCRVYDYGEDSAQKLAWISMEFLPGGSVSRKLKEHPRGFLEPSEIIGWLRELCDALHYAHEIARVVHRDLKPANLMLDARGQLRVTDFGIARSISESFTRLTGEFCPGATTRTGTMYYMSPQQARGERPRPTDDLYSLGATIFELLTGEPPFTAGDLNWQREHAPPAHMCERRQQLHNSASPVPETWERLVQRLLAKHHSHRPQNAREVTRELAQTEVSAVGSVPSTMAQPRTQAPTPPAAQIAPPAAKPSVPASTKRPSPGVSPTPVRSSPWLWALAGLVLLAIFLSLTLLLILRG